jgi:hypothetical protein
MRGPEAEGAKELSPGLISGISFEGAVRYGENRP